MQVRHLVQGLESKERFSLLLKLTKISSESVIDALYAHLVNGLSESEAIACHDVTQSNFNRALTAINEKAAVVEQIKEIDWVRFKSVK